MSGDVPMPNPERFSIRQIGHEVLKTLVKDYSKKPNNYGVDFFMGQMQVTTKPSDSKVAINPISSKKIGRRN